MKKLIITNEQVGALATIMSSLKVGGIDNINRCRGLRLLKSEAELCETERTRLLKEEHAVIDEDTKEPVELPNGSISLKNAKKWNEAIKKLMLLKVTINILTDADKAWVKLFYEVMTSAKRCPEVVGEPALHFDEIVEALKEAQETKPKADEAAKSE